MGFLSDIARIDFLISLCSVQILFWLIVIFFVLEQNFFIGRLH